VAAVSTRCTFHFETKVKDQTVTDAIVYQHSDGYPEGVLPELEEFFATVEAEASDTRYTDPSYLAAKFVVWLAREFTKPTTWAPDRKQGSLDFLSVGICQRDPGDIEYRYHLDCSYREGGGRPVVTHEDVLAAWAAEHPEA
jgi:hypothetical protein